MVCHCRVTQSLERGRVSRPEVSAEIHLVWRYIRFISYVIRERSHFWKVNISWIEKQWHGCDFILFIFNSSYIKR